MSKPRKLSQQLIIEAAVNSLNRGETVTFSSLARQLDCHSQALYPYFKTQRELIRQVALWFIDQLNQESDKAMAGLSGKAAVRALALTVRTIGLANYPVFTMTMRLSSEGTISYDRDSAMAVFRERVRALLIELAADEPQRVLLNRLIRDYVVGEIVNVASGWFQNKTFSQLDSFTKNLNLLLEELPEALRAK
ncbi:TetR/AcrR family transcriptional regulator [Lacticaseibacillus mingshuiensis]|uniref:TetR/AcrR family transcriptional regulator n=1 Tax=Lacticaseibacillus mingshuiensis TaxID=2799574 RepID=A0ABW4CM40_9LACO|nr:TetR/AcrR family transcriptional regulator [Lacticaseibacillus mingshuiensis]